MALKKLQRNAPDTFPVMVLGRLAVALAWERRGLGRALLRDGVLRTLQASEVAGIAAILVYAKSAHAAALYRAAGFEPSPLQANTLMLALAAINVPD